MSTGYVPDTGAQSIYDTGFNYYTHRVEQKFSMEWGSQIITDIYISDQIYI